MDISKLTRDAKQVLSHLTELKDGSVVCDKECKIYIPTRYVERKLAYVGVENYILGIYAIVVDDKYYGVSLVNAMIPIDPTTTNKVKINDDDYYEFVFKPGSRVIKSTGLVKASTITYYIFDEFFSKGYIPWFIGYEELGKVFDSAKYHAGANIGSNQEVTQLIASMLGRDSKDKTKYYRTTINSLKDLETNPPVFVPLKSVEYAATNTLNKLGGSYMQIGITSALINPSTRVEKIENLLRA
jgi:hypothetical protein